jgi:ribonuclease R
LIKGKVQGHPDGFGFLIPDDGSADLVLSAKEMHKALHGDIVMARVGGDGQARSARGQYCRSAGASQYACGRALV